MDKPKRGVLYVASNDKYYLDECIYSAKTFKKYHPNIPVILYTNLQLAKKSIFDTVIFDDSKLSPLLYKAKALNSFPFERTLFIDSDTKICGKLFELFAFVDIYDMALAKRIKAKWSKPFKFIDYEDPSAFNTGVIIYKNSLKTRDFFNQWLKEVIKEDKAHNYHPSTCDQQCFNHLIFNEKLAEKTNISILVLPNRIYNARHMHGQLKKDNLLSDVKIWHSHGLNIGVVQKIKNRLKILYK